MKKILILAYDFPPYISVGGLRPYSWFRYFKKFGLNPVVVTRCWEGNINNPIDYLKPSKNQTVKKEVNEFGTIIRVPYNPNIRDKFILKYGLARFSFIRKSLSFYLSITRFLTFHLDNTANIYKEAEKYMDENKCNMILATGEPFILFKYASKLSDKFNIPWIADYRDGWSTNIANSYSGIFNKILMKYYFQKLEKKYLSNIALICTAAPSYKRDLKGLHINKRIEVVYNGYDPDVVHILKGISQNNECFEIAYSGTIYPHQQLEFFLEGYRNFIKETGCKNTKTVFYGINFYNEQKNRLLSFDNDLNNFIETTDRLPYNTVMKKLGSANLLLLLADDQTEQLVAKVFEYFALNRKILLVKDDNAILSKLIDKCNGGIKCSSAEDITSALKSLYLEFLDKGFIEHKSVNYTIYNRKKQAELLSKIIMDNILVVP